MTDTDKQIQSSWRRARLTDGPCPPSARIAALAVGRVWPWQRRRLVDHLATCPACAADYRVLDTARDGLQSALQSHEAAPRAGAAFGRFGFAAAALVAVVVGGFLLSNDPGTIRTPGQPGAGTATPDAIFSSAFEPGERPASNTEGDSDTLFRSDFSPPRERRKGTFSDGFG